MCQNQVINAVINYYDDQELSNDQGICDAFCQYFSSEFEPNDTFSNVSDTLPTLTGTNETYISRRN